MLFYRIVFLKNLETQSKSKFYTLLILKTVQVYEIFSSKFFIMTVPKKIKNCYQNFTHGLLAGKLTCSEILPIFCVKFFIPYVSFKFKFYITLLQKNIFL